MERKMDDKYWDAVERLMDLMVGAKETMEAEGFSECQFANVSKDVGLLLFIAHGFARSDYQGDGCEDDAITESLMLQAVIFSFLAGVEELKGKFLSYEDDKTH